MEHYSTTTGDIVIDANPALLENLQVLKDTIIDVAANTYRYDIEIQFTSGVVKTYVGLIGAYYTRCYVCMGRKNDYTPCEKF